MTYRIFGSEISPYSMKVRSYFRYKGIPHEWIIRSTKNQEEFQKLAKLPLVPLVVTPEGEALQDSTPIIEKIEAVHPEPPIHPADPVLAFLSALIEEFGDEWGNKWMFHYRWARPADQDSGADRIARDMMPDLDDEARAGVAQGIKDRMVNRVWFVGSSEKTAGQIESSFIEVVDQLDAHLASRPYLFGARPVFGDFGLWGQIYEAWTDPTAGSILRERGPNVVGWVERMLEPKLEGEVESWQALEPTLLPIIAGAIAQLFLPWSDANARAIATGAEEFEVDLAGRPWEQKPQKYHARSLQKLRERYAATAGNAELDSVLERSGCLVWLTASDR